MNDKLTMEANRAVSSIVKAAVALDGKASELVKALLYAMLTFTADDLELICKTARREARSKSDRAGALVSVYASNVRTIGKALDAGWAQTVTPASPLKATYDAARKWLDDNGKGNAGSKGGRPKGSASQKAGPVETIKVVAPPQPKTAEDVAKALYTAMRMSIDILPASASKSAPLLRTLGNMLREWSQACTEAGLKM